MGFELLANILREVQRTRDKIEKTRWEIPRRKGMHEKILPDI